MIQELSVRNFKSIKDLQIDCKRVNIFIGEPNSGKSNLLESLSLLNSNERITDYIRLVSVSQLFFDFDLSKNIEIRANDYSVKAWIDEKDQLAIESKLGQGRASLISTDLSGENRSASYSDNALTSIPKVRFYRFKDDVTAKKADKSFLETPFGGNIAFVVLSNKELREQVQVLLDGLGYKLLFKPNENYFEIYKEHAGFSISFPISIISDTVKRMIFYLSAIESNKQSAIIFEEPESNTFPLYIKYLAERIAKFSNNQYFITTHNPYFLQTIIEKTPVSDLAINLVKMEDYKTKVITIAERGVEEILNLSSDVFLNFDKLLDE